MTIETFVFLCTGLAIVIGGANLFWLVRIRRTQRAIQMIQTMIKARQTAIEEVMSNGELVRQLAGAASWRDLEPETRQIFAQALLKLAEQMQATVH